MQTSREAKLSLAEVPLLLVLVGLTAYATLGGADFGAGLWQLVDARASARQRRELVHRAMAAVWEANHVWLIFVLVIFWTAYPVAFASVASTLAVPFFIAAVGIILRGTAYAVRTGAHSAREASQIDLVFAASSVLTPFALGTMVGAVASARVPVGNAAGDLWASWVAPTPLFIGVLAVAATAYVASVFLTGDARRLGREDLAQLFRRRALVSGITTGTLALAGLLVVRSDANRLYDGLTSGAGLIALAASAVAGAMTLLLLWRCVFEPARYTAAAAVGAVVVGWGVAQEPFLLPGLTVEEAAAGRSTLLAITIGVVGGAVVLLPSLALLFRMVLRGSFDSMEPTAAPACRDRARLPVPRSASGPLTVGAGATGTALALFGGRGLEPIGIGMLLLTVPAGTIWLLLHSAAGAEQAQTDRASDGER